ncbi:unnamed protein product, partial [Nippostrongylus brasiliensis]|uniref:Glycogen-binding subunit 76A (inferred by orthology to a D. melanogaster protein) n=1 Tax=Nippostrongylus brasiliensis TaxID=27835 RepID=A0A0N4XPS4_NIPBR
EYEYNQCARDQKVCLAKLRTQGYTISGQINVANIAFSKQVAIRYTTNDWASYDEVAASYGHNIFGADNVDAFVFSMILPSDMKEGRCQFCVRFSVQGGEYWDNNLGANYIVDAVAENSTRSAFSGSAPPSRVMFPPSTPSLFGGPRRLRRWDRAQDESDDELSRVYIPRRRAH